MHMYCLMFLGSQKYAYVLLNVLGSQKYAYVLLNVFRKSEILMINIICFFNIVD